MVTTVATAKNGDGAREAVCKLCESDRQGSTHHDHSMHSTHSTHSSVMLTRFQTME